MTALIVFILGSLVHEAPANPEGAILEMSRSLPPGITETVVVKFSNGEETIFMTSNRFMPDRPEVGIFKRKSVSLYNRIKTLKEPKAPGASGYVSPHAWRVRVFGKEIPGGDRRVNEVEAMISAELKDSAAWKAAETAKVELKMMDAVFTYARPGSPAQVEKKNALLACQPFDGKMMCTSKMGYVFVK